MNPDASKRIVPEPPAEPDPYKGPDSWNGDPPQPDTIGGTLIERDEVSTDKHGGATVPLLRIQNGNGEVTDVPCWRAHLRQLVEAHDPQEGDGISIRAFGARPGELQKLYGVRVRKAEASDDTPPF